LIIMQNIRPPLRALRRRVGGFTLIELMIAVAIVGILVAVAYPAYTQSVLKSHRAEAKAALLDLASREERYFSTTNQYSNSGPALGYATGTTLTPAAPLPVLTGSTAYYNLSVSAPTATPPAAPTFLATATAVGTQVNDTKCKDFSLSQSGVQSVSGTDSAGSCW
jgi:type IV pilus assembly protein PilE